VNALAELAPSLSMSLGIMSAEATQPWAEEVRRARRGDSSAFEALVRGTWASFLFERPAWAHLGADRRNNRERTVATD